MLSRDQGFPQRSDTSRITIEIVDSNDNPPIFTVFSNANITEDIQIGDFVNSVSATDADANDLITFYIENSNSFYIESNGIIRANRYVVIFRIICSHCECLEMLLD